MCDADNSTASTTTKMPRTQHAADVLKTASSLLSVFQGPAKAVGDPLPNGPFYPSWLKRLREKFPFTGRGVGRSGSGVKTKSSKKGAGVFLDHQSSSVHERKPYVEWLAYTCIASGLGTVTSLVAFRHGSWLLLPSSSAPFPFCTHTHTTSAQHTLHVRNA